MTFRPSFSLPLKKAGLILPVLPVVLLLAIALLLTVFFGGGQRPEAFAGDSPGEVQEKTSADLAFVALGDTGSGAPAQQDIARQLVAFHQKHSFRLVLHLGDILYPAGEFEATGKKLYLDVYRPLMEQGVRIRPVLGNHDVLKGFRPGILAFYGMPGRYYTFSEIGPDGRVDFFAVDTNLPKGDPQWPWLDAALGQSRADWKIVYGHHPIDSSGLHGNSAALRKTLEPLLVKHQVRFYLAGHDHDYERFAPINGVVYLVSGGGGAYLRPFAPKQKGSLVRLKKHHFLYFRLRDQEMEVQAIDTAGQVIDRAVYPLR